MPKVGHDYQVLAINHTSFTVSSLDRSIAFFEDCLGFNLTSRAKRDRSIIEKVVGVAGADIEVAYLRGARHVIELIEYFAPAGRTLLQSRACDVGFAHVAFDVSNMDRLLEAAEAYGFKPLAPPVKIGAAGPNGGRLVCYMRDGDGVTIELIETPKAR